MKTQEPSAPPPRAPRRPALVPLVLGRRQRCPMCHDALRPGEPLLACGDCRAVFHAECAWDGCPTLGCGARRARAWGERGRWRRWLPWLTLAAAALAVALHILLLPRVEPGPLPPEPWPVPVEPPVARPPVVIEPPPPPPALPPAPRITLEPALAGELSGTCRLRAQVDGQGSAAVRVLVDGREHVGYALALPGALDLVVPVEPSGTVVVIEVEDARGRVTRVARRLRALAR
ncbi:MAG: hypothetical protein AB7N76_05760 [Planctomycetota bacterium]